MKRNKHGIPFDVRYKQLQECQAWIVKRYILARNRHEIQKAIRQRKKNPPETEVK